MSLKEYKPGTAFTGVVGRTFDTSEQAWPEPNRAKEGAPNVLFIVLDDVGFGPEAPAEKEKNWVKTAPGKGWFTYIRLYGPLEAFFEQTWKPDDIVKI